MEIGRRRRTGGLARREGEREEDDASHFFFLGFSSSVTFATGPVGAASSWKTRPFGWTSIESSAFFGSTRRSTSGGNDSGESFSSAPTHLIEKGVKTFSSFDFSTHT